MRSLYVAAVVVICLTFVCSGQWSDAAWGRLPGEIKTHFYVHSYDGSVTLSIMAFAHSENAWKALLGEEFETSSDSINTVSNHVLDTFDGALSIVVAVMSSGNQSWWPWEIDIVQPPSQYSVSYSDVIEMAYPFSGGVIRDGVVAWGFIRIPDGIDANEPATLWIGDDCGTIQTLSCPAEFR